MQKLLSLPPNLANTFYRLEKKSKDNWFCASDPIGKRVGSGGGTAWLLKEYWEKKNQISDFRDWISKDKKIVMHAGGQSRRLPAYAPTGKILTPIPIFRWERGQKIDQNLLDLQLPLYEKILEKSAKNSNTLIASGDVYIRSEGEIKFLPEADVICYGLWVNPSQACNHGVFVCDKTQPKQLNYMLQKPGVQELQDLAAEHLYLMDIGIWVLSDKAVELLMKKSDYHLNEKGELESPAQPGFYDLYSDFGLCLGDQPKIHDEDLSQLSVAILPLPKGEFYHYGTSKELISSTLNIQNKVLDQRSILHKDRKPHPSMFIQNAEIEIKLEAQQQNLWIENSFIGKNWKLESNHVLTGIPKNNWQISLEKNICIDIIPIGDSHYCLRPYDFDDAFRGAINSDTSFWMGNSFLSWMEKRDIIFSDLNCSETTDLQAALIFPVLKVESLTDSFVNWMIKGEPNEALFQIWKCSEKLSADMISDLANLDRLVQQREDFRNSSVKQLHKNHRKSVFFQLDLNHAAKYVVDNKIQLPPADLSCVDEFVKMHEHMFQARVKQYNKLGYLQEEKQAFDILQQSIIQPVQLEKLNPELNVFQDQIVWGRSPVRIDLAGGWSDTPPYCLINGGAVVNMAIELNGQPPLQVYIKPSKEYKIILRSIDIGTREDVQTFEELANCNQVGSPFSIPKAALALAGFHPEYSQNSFSSLEKQLEAFGSGIEISSLAAIPKGSGLGTSSILGATVLGALSDFCGHNWSHNQISHRALVLEQLLTTGGGWQDQYGGVLPGIKLLETGKGFNQTPEVRWGPDHLFTTPENKACLLLYYTGITRTAKDILSEIVRGMFLNDTKNTSLLKEMKQHAYDTFDILQRNDFKGMCNAINTTWRQNQLLDGGTNPLEIQKLIHLFKDYTSAYKLPGAGGGGYLFIVAKDPEAAGKIRNILNENPPNSRARFVDLNLSKTGFQVTRS